MPPDLLDRAGELTRLTTAITAEIAELRRLEQTHAGSVAVEECRARLVALVRLRSRLVHGQRTRAD